MKVIIAVFRSRTETMKFYNLLGKSGVACEIISTPREAKVGCGLSVKFDGRYLSSVNKLLPRYGFKSFVSFYETGHFGIKRISVPY